MKLEIIRKIDIIIIIIIIILFFFSFYSFVKCLLH